MTSSIAATDALVLVGLANSRANARRGIEQRGHHLNGEPLSDASRLLVREDAVAGRFLVP